MPSHAQAARVAEGSLDLAICWVQRERSRFERGLDGAPRRRRPAPCGERGIRRIARRGEGDGGSVDADHPTSWESSNRTGVQFAEDTGAHVVSHRRRRHHRSRVLRARAQAAPPQSVNSPKGQVRRSLPQGLDRTSDRATPPRTGRGHWCRAAARTNPTLCAVIYVLRGRRQRRRSRRRVVQAPDKRSTRSGPVTRPETETVSGLADPQQLCCHGRGRKPPLARADDQDRVIKAVVNQRSGRERSRDLADRVPRGQQRHGYAARIEVCARRRAQSC